LRTRRPLAVLALAFATGCGSTVQVTGSGASLGAQGEGLGAPGAAAPGTGVGGGAPLTGGTQSSSGSLEAGAAGTTRPPGSAAVPGQAGTVGTVAPGAAAAIPASGRGWTGTTVTIGVMTQQDVQQVAESAGVSNVDSGDQVADVQAVIKHVNATGGLFGRQVKADIFDIKSTGDAETQGQAACQHFTRDTPAVAVYAMALVGDTPSFRSCMAKAQVPVLAGGGQAFDDQVFRELGGYYTLMPFPSYDRFVPYFVDHLVAMGYFSPWDPTLGAPGTGKDKVGFLCPDTPIGHRVGGIVARQLKRVGHPAQSEVYYSTSNADVSGYVLRMKSDGISHVLFCDLGLFVFATQAETQRYRPRYGVSTFNTPVLFLQGVVPDAQLAGAVGSGFDPTLDVDAAHDPSKAELPAVAACEEIARKAGLSYAPERRFAHGVLYDTCDILQLIVASAKAAVSLDGPGLVRGLGIAGARWSPAVTWRSGLSPTVHAMPTAARDLFFEDDCRCFQYRGRTTSFS
jgi:hypothetical protein